ncbi:bidirectional sugar transporter SWEET4-like [Asparagus officinalis]|uniref:bidirectional sugar transporter SWEET4-like n=1 Tax=Asparagus officinalis TaxID=4686 RepID=UPI00098E3027|nr:bidirectional sugar transporter SWEET4-like [Asparagus officinalis]
MPPHFVHPAAPRRRSPSTGGASSSELCYLIVYILYSPAKQKLNVILSIVAEVVVVVAFGALLISFVHDEHTRSTIVGILCIVFCIIMYVAPLAAMKLVITTKSVEFMPLYLSVASFLNGACWTVYSLLKFDINILVPNGIGLLLTVVQLVLYAMYYRSTQKILRERKKGDIDMSDVKKEDNQS